MQKRLLLAFAAVISCATMAFSLPFVVYGPRPSLGGTRLADVNSQTIQDMAQLGVSQMGTEYTLVSINRAETQVVAGTLYIMEVNVEKTSPLGSIEQLTCVVKVIDTPWENRLGLDEFSCNASN